MASPISPLPLVTATFTTDELAKCVAGLNLLRKEWARHGMEAGLMQNEPERVRALDVVSESTDLINRITGMVSNEQSAALMGDLIRDMKKRGPNG